MPSKTQRRLEREQARTQQKTRRMIYIGGASVALIVALGAVVFYFNSRSASSAAVSTANCSNIQTTADEGNTHLQPNETYKYQTNPPVSGAHDPVPWPAGIYNVPILAAREVHSLEHGYVIIHYNGIPSNEVEQLAALVRADSWKTILSPLPTMAYKVSLTAWDHAQTCDGVNPQAIRSFISVFRDRGPEQTPM